MLRNWMEALRHHPWWLPQTLWCGLCLVFRASERFFCEFTIWSWQKFFWSEKNQNVFGSREWLSLLKVFSSWTSWPVIKSIPFSSCMWKNKCLHVQLIRNSYTYMSLVMYLIDLLGSLYIIVLFWPTILGILFSSEQSEWEFRDALRSQSSLDSSSSFRILRTIFRLTYKLCKSFVMELPNECLAIQHAVSKLLEEWITSCGCFPPMTIWLSLLHSRQYLE